jgi:hypothetical protein
MSPLVIFLLFSQLAPPQDYIGKIPPFSPLTQHAPRYLIGDQLKPLADRNTCYAIRSYIFKREDGNAPVLVGTTTCTPADALRRLQVKHRPKAGLVLLDLSVHGPGR